MPADGVRRDLRIGFRLLVKEKAFCAMAVVVLALGIGGVTAMFSVVNGVMLRGFSFPNARRLVSVNFIDELPLPRKLKRFPPTVGALVETVLPDIVRSVNVPELLLIWIWNSKLLLIVVFVMLVGLAPAELVPVSCVTLIPDSSLAALSPLLVMLQLAIWRPLIPEPPMPLPRLLVMLM